MKKLLIKTDKLGEKNNFEISITDNYYEFLHKEVKKITNPQTGIIETKSLVGAFINLTLEKKQIEDEINKIYSKLP